MTSSNDSVKVARLSFTENSLQVWHKLQSRYGIFTIPDLNLLWISNAVLNKQKFSPKRTDSFSNVTRVYWAKWMLARCQAKIYCIVYIIQFTDRISWISPSLLPYVLTKRRIRLKVCVSIIKASSVWAEHKFNLKVLRQAAKVVIWKTEVACSLRKYQLRLFLQT